MRKIKSKIDYYPINKLEELLPLPGIYRLFKSADKSYYLVYIGKSRNIRWRLMQHTRKKLIQFDVFNYSFYPERHLEKIEKEILSSYLQKFKCLPRYNKQLG
ncbi:MAG: GIY-YIG nuclease family protein [Candidatus Levybacteria bacterium]|nr:GIY-YIG nuclease family protein [Candidatus Levybacteria bacterium]